MTALTPLLPGSPPAGPGRQGPGQAAAALATAAPAIEFAHASPADIVLRQGAQTGRLIHVEYIPGREGQPVPWPGWVPSPVREGFSRAGVPAPWAHQITMAGLARAGRDVIIATGTASGKSLGFLLPALTAALDGGTTVYLAPTRALAADQLRAIAGLGLADVRAAVLDGDTPAAQRDWARSHANYLLTTPDMLHQTLLPRHARWNGFFRRLRYVVVDECHTYRGVFGTQVAQVLRRLDRVAGHHRGSPPVFLLASATVSDPSGCARLLTGRPAHAVTENAAPRGPVTFALWEPPLTPGRGELGAPVRRSATTETAGLLADLVAEAVPVLAFTRSRRGAEAVAMAARRALREAGAGACGERVAAYRSGYLSADRRALEQGVRSGDITGLATTTALELGVDITGLDAVLIAGWPGTRASLWQQAGRAGRAGQEALVVLIARDDPLDTYLVHHPAALLHRPVEATVLDPGNPYVLAPHLCAAAAELPLTAADLARFGPGAADIADALVRRGLLRRRGGGGLYWTGRGRPSQDGLRGTGSRPVKIVEQPTGRLVGTVDEPSAHLLVHDGAVYPHQGEMYLVDALDLAGGVALVRAADPGYTTSARQITAIDVARELRHCDWGAATVHFGDVQVRRQVTGYLRRSTQTGRPLGGAPLSLPAQTLHTRAVWWTVPAAQRAALLGQGVDLAGAAHAAEHASIGLLPLFAACDRWDVGGVSADLHPATGLLTVFVYDGHDGGAGFAERGYAAAREWLAASADAIRGCECECGCPSCIQSPKCGNGNEPLSKPGAVTLLELVLGNAPPGH